LAIKEAAGSAAVQGAAFQSAIDEIAGSAAVQGAAI